MKNLDYLRRQVYTLSALLQDPHPGVSSWVEAYADKMEAITNFWRAGESSTVERQQSESIINAKEMGK